MADQVTNMGQCGGGGGGTPFICSDLALCDTDDLAEGSSNLYFSNERAQDAVGSILTDSSSVDFTYNDGAGTITAVVLAAGVDHGGLGGLSDDDHTQYARLAGRSGGQTLIGGTGTSDSLTFKSTSANGDSFANDIVFKGGNNGSLEFLRFLTDGTTDLWRVPNTFLVQAKDSTNSSYLKIINVANDTLVLNGEAQIAFQIASSPIISCSPSGIQCQQSFAFTNSAIDPHLTFNNAASFAQILCNPSVNLFITMAGGTGDIVFRTNSATECARITADGNLRLGGRATAAELIFLEPSGSGSNYTSFKAQAQSGNITYTLPPDDGDANEFLMTDGSGSLTWEPAALLTGKSGGQTLQGGTAASNNLTLESTAHATKGSVIVNDLLDISIVAAGSPRLKIAATSDTPTATWGAAAGNEVSTTPAGWLEVNVGGNSRYIPFWA